MAFSLRKTSLTRSDLNCIRGSALFGISRHPILTDCFAFRPLCWSIGYGEETSPSHPDGLLRFPTAFSPIQGEALNHNYLIINY